MLQGDDRPGIIQPCLRTSARPIEIAHKYEYLAFTYKVHRLGIPDLLGRQWLELWIRSLAMTEEFHDVHNSYEGYYPEFEAFVDDLLKSTPAALNVP